MSMMRTRLRDRDLPAYTKGEEIFNMVSHIVGGGLGLIFSVLCLIRAWGDPWAVGGSLLFGLSFILLYTISSLYHGLRRGTAERVLQVLDHCTIYLFIAGTYTPIMLCAVRPLYPFHAWLIFSVVWALAILAIIFNGIDLKKYSLFSMICYIGMGWAVVLGLGEVISSLPGLGFPLLLSGGISYTIGAVLYGVGKKKRYFHGVFHLFTLLGSLLHGLCILFYVL